MNSCANRPRIITVLIATEAGVGFDGQILDSAPAKSPHRGRHCRVYGCSIHLWLLHYLGL